MRRNGWMCSGCIGTIAACVGSFIEGFCTAITEVFEVASANCCGTRDCAFGDCGGGAY